MTAPAGIVNATGRTSDPVSSRPVTAATYAADALAHRARFAAAAERVARIGPETPTAEVIEAQAEYLAAFAADQAATVARLAGFGFRTTDTADGLAELRRTVFCAALQAVARRTAARSLHRDHLTRMSSHRTVDLGGAALVYGLELVTNRTRHGTGDDTPLPELVRCHRPITAHGPPTAATSEPRSTCVTRHPGRARATGPVHPARRWPTRPHSSPGGRPPP